jgi:predicted permease
MAGFTVLVLALGIGLSTALFSLLDGVLLRGLPFPDGDRIVTLHTLGEAGRPMPAADFQFLQREQRILPKIAAFRTYNSVVTRPGEGSKGLTATYVTGNLFSMLGVQPLLGRNFSPADEDPAAPAVAMISHQVWQSHFAGDPQVLGRTILLNREAMTVVGVMPPGFRFPVRQEAWGVLRWEGRPWSQAGVFGVGKLPPTLSPAAAADRLQPLMASLDGAAPRPEARRFLAVPYVEAVAPAALQTALRLMLFAVLGVLLIAVANAANLRLADALAREQDLIVRRALGARGGQVLRLLMAEAVLLVGASTAAGMVTGWLLTRLVAARFLQGSGLVRLFWIDVRFDLRAGVFAVAVAAGVVLLSGLLPALWALRRKDPRIAQRSRSSRSSGTLRLIQGLVAGEVALCFALVVASGLLVQSGVALLSQTPAFDPTHLTRTLVNTYQADWQTPAEARAFWREVLPRLAARPEIAGVTLTDTVPWQSARRVSVRTDPTDDHDTAALPEAEFRRILPGFFATMRWPLVMGRTLGDGDLPPVAPGPESLDRHDPAPLPVVVSASFARHYFPDEPLGQRFDLMPTAQDPAPRTATIIGVVADGGLGRRDRRGRRDRSDRSDSEDAIYAPFAFPPQGGAFLVVRSRDGATTAGLQRILDQGIARANPLVATLDAQSYAAARAEQVWVERRLAELLSFFSAASLLLSAIGLFGVISLSVHYRRKELAIRSALGARPGNLRARLLAEGAVCGALGLGFGGLLFTLGQGALRAFLHGVEPWDPAILASTTAAVVGVLLLATLVPAQRAAATDPATVLKEE